MKKIHGNKWKDNGPKSLECSKKEVYSNTGLAEETRKIWNKLSEFMLKGPRKWET